MTEEVTRRAALRLGGLAGIGLLVGCTSSSSPTTTTSAPRITTTPVPPPTASTGSRPSYAQLGRTLGNRLALRGDSGYDAATLLYNPRFADQPKPQAIAHCASSSDVAACVRFAADGGAPIRIRNGGHSYGGWSSGPGLVIDLATMNSVQVDHAAKTARVGAGARLAEVYTQLAAQGASIAAGSCATVGVTGLCLGGGVGVLTRAYGLTIDQVASFEAVTADGRVRTVDSTSDADLFWALRGGGGSFAAVTAITFRVRPAPTIQQFFFTWPWSAAGEVLSAWQHWMRSAPREVMTSCKLLADPGKGMTPSVSGCWVGTGSADTTIDALLRVLPRPTTTFRNTAGYGETMLGEAGCSGETAQTCIANALTPAQRQPSAATSAIMQAALPDAGVTAIVNAVAAGMDIATMVEGGVSFDSFGGAVADVAPDGTAFPWRTALADVQYTATWPSAQATNDPSPYDGFVHAERTALQPWLGASAYANYADPDLSDYAEAYWGDNLPRLQQVKRSYDPNNVFSFPQSVPV